MELTFLRPQGPQPAEMEGLAELKRGLPKRWRAYANFIMRHPGRRGQDREIDVVMITDDRLVLIDLKHWSGRIENRGGYWHRNDERRDASPAHKIREHAKVLATLVRNGLQELRTVPPVESLVVFTHPKVDISGLEKSELERSLKLAEFLDIANDKKFKSLFTSRSAFDVANSLCGKHVAAFRKFFSNGRFFEPRKAVFHGFVPTGLPELEHGKLFVEYACRGASDPNYTGLLRLWDFGDAGDELCVEEPHCNFDARAQQSGTSNRICPQRQSRKRRLVTRHGAVSDRGCRRYVSWREEPACSNRQAVAHFWANLARR